MTGWLFHLALSSAGLAAAGGVLRLAAALRRNDPVAWYRLGVTALVVTLGLAAAQAAVAGVRWLWFRPGLVEHHEERYLFLRPHGPESAPVPVLPPRQLVADPRPGVAALDQPVATGLLALYAAGVGVVGLYHGQRLRRTMRFLRGCRPLQDPAALAVWRRVAEGSPLRDRVRLLTYPGLAAPCCWGLWHPYLVMPEGVYDSDALEWALRHELAHLERRDARFAVLQAGLTTLFWFHPVAWWLSRRLDEWCELSCDQRVVARTGRRKRYALALLEFAARSQGAAGMLHGSASHLRRRIEMLATARRRSGRGFLHRTLSAVLVVSGVAQLALAASLPAVVRRDPPEQRQFEVKIILRPPDRPGR